MSRITQISGLTESAGIRYTLFSVLYFAQGIPNGIISYAIPAWLAANGKSPMEIAAVISVNMIPWSFKFLVAPLLDRYTIIPMGRKRPWVIFGQLGLIISLMSFGFISEPLHNLSGLMICAFFVGLFGSFQDIATDGMAIDVIPEDQQARANGLMWGNKIIGISISMVLGTFLINKLGLSIAVPMLSIIVFIILLFPLFIRERKGEKLLPWTTGEASPESKENQSSGWYAIFKSLWRVMLLPSSLIVGILSLTIGIISGFIDALLPIFTVQGLHWTNSAYSNVFSIINVVAGLLGIVIGGILVDRKGKRKMMYFCFAFMAVLIGGFGSLSSFWHYNIVIYTFMLLYYTTYVFLCIAYFACAMNLCWKKVAATQFTLFMAISNLGSTLGTTLMGYLKSGMGWEQVILISSIIPLISILLIKYIDFQRQSNAILKFNEQVLPI